MAGGSAWPGLEVKLACFEPHPQKHNPNGTLKKWVDTSAQS